MVFEHALDRQRNVVIARAFAVTRAGDRVLPRLVGPAVFVAAGRDDTDGLPLQHRERHRAEVEHDVVGVVLAPDLGHALVADYFSADEGLRACGAVQVGIGMRRRPGRQRRIVALVAEAFAGDRFHRHQRRRLAVVVRRRGLAVGAELVFAQFVGQLLPAELLLDAVGTGAGNAPPVVDRPGRAGRDAGHAKVALVGIDHVIVVIVRDRVDRAGRLAGAAANADLGIDQVLFENLGRSIHQDILTSFVIPAQAGIL